MRRLLMLIVVTCQIAACGPATGSTPPSPSVGPSGTPASASPTAGPTAVPSGASTSSPPPSEVATSSPPAELSAAEARLLEELRADSRIGCGPRRTDLPPGSTVGVECRVGSNLVDRVGVYGFPADDGLGTSAIGAYLARLAERGVAVGSGDCAAGTPGDAHWPTYLPDEGADGTGPSEMRIGCYHDENGNANIRVTCYNDVYIGILGTGRDIASLYAWAEQVAAGESTDRDPPGICARPD